jgi:competence protein ComEA
MEMVKKFLSVTIYCMIGLLSAGLVLLIARPPQGEPVIILPTKTESTIVIYLTGAIIHPGVYELPPGSRLENAISAAGGFSEKANISSVNLASEIKDGQSFYIRTVDEEDTGISKDEQGIINTEGLIDINTATSEQLQQLPGIGPTKAEAIMEFRETNGPFQTLNDLLLVPGIGESTLAQIMNFITLNP